MLLNIGSRGIFLNLQSRFGFTIISRLSTQELLISLGPGSLDNLTVQKWQQSMVTGEIVDLRNWNVELIGELWL